MTLEPVETGLSKKRLFQEGKILGKAIKIPIHPQEQVLSSSPCWFCWWIKAPSSNAAKILVSWHLLRSATVLCRSTYAVAEEYKTFACMRLKIESKLLTYKWTFTAKPTTPSSCLGKGDGQSRLKMWWTFNVWPLCQVNISRSCSTAISNVHL